MWEIPEQSELYGGEGGLGEECMCAKARREWTGQSAGGEQQVWQLPNKQ